MNIAWITGRDLNQDLASTTELGIINCLREEEMVVNVFSPTKKINKLNFDYIEFKKIRIKGLETITGGVNLKSKLKNNTKLIDLADYIIIDWRYVPLLRRRLRKINKSWFIIDRGPPVYKSILTKIQKRMWKRAWKIASKEATGGFVVSKEHRKLVKRIDVSLNPHIINAGTRINDFTIKDKIIKDTVKLAYSGRIDKNRGMESLIRLSENLEKEAIVFEIHIMGEGDYDNVFERLSQRNDSIIFHNKISRERVFKILEDMHFGIMPMPNKTVWQTASPIKLVEYMASGMLIIGQDHSGNRTSDNNQWSLLTKGENWTYMAPEKIKKVIENNNFKELSNLSRDAAKEYDWKFITHKMIKYIKNH